MGASEKEGAEGLQEPERQPEQPGAPDLRAPQGVPEATEPLSEGEAAAPEGDPVSPGVTLASETAVGEAAVGAVEDPGHLAREVMQPLCGEGVWRSGGFRAWKAPGRTQRRLMFQR